MASARTLKRRAQRYRRKHPIRGESGVFGTLSRILAAYCVNTDVVDRLCSQSVLYDRRARRAPMDVTGRAYTYSLYTNYNAHQACDLPDAPSD